MSYFFLLYSSIQSYYYYICFDLYLSNFIDTKALGHNAEKKKLYEKTQGVKLIRYVGTSKESKKKIYDEREMSLYLQVPSNHHNSNQYNNNVTFLGHTIIRV